MFKVELATLFRLILKSADTKVSTSTGSYEFLKSLETFLLAMFLSKTLRRLIDLFAGWLTHLFAFFLNLRRRLVGVGVLLDALLLLKYLFQSLAVLVDLLGVGGLVSLGRNFVRNLAGG